MAQTAQVVWQAQRKFVVAKHITASAFEAFPVVADGIRDEVVSFFTALVANRNAASIVFKDFEDIAAGAGSSADNIVCV